MRCSHREISWKVCDDATAAVSSKLKPPHVPLPEFGHHAGGLGVWPRGDASGLSTPAASGGTVAGVGVAEGGGWKHARRSRQFLQTDSSCCVCCRVENVSLQVFEAEASSSRAPSGWLQDSPRSCCSLWVNPFVSLADAVKSLVYVMFRRPGCLFYDLFISCSASPGSIPVAAFHHLFFLLSS